MEDFDEIDSLLSEVKNHVYERLDDSNVPILSAIAKVRTKRGREYDLHSLDDALCLIHTRFKRSHREERRLVFKTFGLRLEAANAGKLTSEYNYVLESVRKRFPSFNLVHRSHNPYFGKNAIVSCKIRRCSEEELVEQATQDDPFHNNTTNQVIEEEKELWKTYYHTEYAEDVKSQARALARAGTLSSLSKGLQSTLDYGQYTGNDFMKINTFMRCNKTTGWDMETLVKPLSLFFPSVVFPFHSSKDFVVYRGDDRNVSSESLTTRGFLSASLSLQETEQFTKRQGGRVIQINIPAGLPFIPTLLHNLKEGEIVLLPGTKLSRISKLKLERGHFAEYAVTDNPPELNEDEKATILKFSIPEHLRQILNMWSLGNVERKKWVESRPAEIGGSSEDEIVQFYVDLINRKYGGDW